MIRHDYHKRANGKPHPYESVRWLGWGMLVCAGLLLALILAVSTGIGQDASTDDVCEGLPALYGTDC